MLWLPLNLLARTQTYMARLQNSLTVSFARLLFTICLAHGGMAQVTAPSGSNPLRLTLEEALRRARENSVTYQAAITDASLAREDKKQAIGALLPSVNYVNSAIYTEGNGIDDQFKFIANNAIREYISQGGVHETLDAAGFAEARRASALAAAARARQEIAARGLVATVVQSYFGVAAAQNKLETMRRAADEGSRFLSLAQNLERGGEVAHSDVIKAELQANDRSRQFQEATLAFLNAKLDLAVLVFPDFNESFEVVDALHTTPALPALSDVEARASDANPEIRAALETANAARQGLLAAREGYLPSLGFDYFYGIDATHFATKNGGISNLGSSIAATVNIPLWNWGSTQSKVKQAALQRDQAQRELSLARRKLLAELRLLYAEAQTAANELANLERSAHLGQESLRLTTLRYQNGESTVLEVVDAQNTATADEVASEDGAVRYKVALANLQTLTGVLTIR